MSIIDRIKELANARNISLAELERRTKLSSGSITKWGKSSPSADKLDRVADFFEVSTDYLLGRTERKDPWPESDPYDDFKDVDIDETDLAKMIDNAMSFDGKPINDHDKEVILAFLKGKYGLD